MRHNQQKKGPKPSRLQLDEENWENGLKKAIRKEKPKDGWPKKGKDKPKS